MDEALSALKEIGLTDYEAKAYITLSKLRRAKASEIKEESGVPYSKIYETAERLEDKGLIETVQESPRSYRILDPEESIDNYVEGKINRLRECKEEALKNVTRFYSSSNITAIVLAAGPVKDEDKLLMKLGNKTVIEHVIDVLRSSKIDRIILVLGYKPERIKSKLSDVISEIDVVEIDDYERGFTYSFKKGLKEVKDSSAVLLALGDQPFLDTKFLNGMVEKSRSEEGKIISPEYEGSLGHPVIFSNEVFEDILSLKENETIKKVLDDHQKDLITVKGGNWTLLDVDSFSK